jgi:hypothetical protein
VLADRFMVWEFLVIRFLGMALSSKIANSHRSIHFA